MGLPLDSAAGVGSKGVSGRTLWLHRGSAGTPSSGLSSNRPNNHEALVEMTVCPG